MNVIEADLLVVGAGPVGLYAAYYAGFRGLSTVVADSLPEVGGQVSAMYPEKPIYDVAGFPMVRGRDLVARLAAQAAVFDPTYLLGHRVQELVREHDGTIVATTHTGTEVRCRAVVISGGIGTFTPRPLPAGETWLGRGLSYFVPSLGAHAGQDVVVVGGGDSAVDWALSLEPIARSVTLVHRRAAFRAHEHSVARLRSSSVEIITDAEVTALDGGDLLTTVVVTGPGGSAARPAQAVIAALGFTANLGPIRSWGIEVIGNRYLPVNTAMATDVPGVFAAGDITEYPGKVRLIVVGFGEAATAVNNAAVLINPDEALFPGHSSDAAPALV
ncbi:NAD(P)/FAD-dependent oxidoreductase [Actinospica sp. MGRD01-02]|uniref:Ferredoxin--NADP reductase n=1 Tax=Actinospica acidithermotolerans TaxID=2828514 RepID=A0A941EDF6_9ACTN|nr:NAD(P)/FAD-dependent oxidoreductase [Actinospica acidithermotolerans]MBR7827004.1 NAD(P)/FAD-dependent oxidoreductase [Actinospica acidithermotolerans]